MKLKKTVVITLILHILLGLLGCLLYEYFFQYPKNTLSQDVVFILIISSALLFIDIFPLLHVSSIFVGYVIVFSDSSQQYDKKTERPADHLKGAFVLILFCIALSAIFTEGLRPYLLYKQRTARFQAHHYYSSLHAAEQAMRNSDYERAQVNVEQALWICPACTEVKKIHDDLAIILEAEMQTKKNTPFEETESMLKDMSPEQALNAAQDYFTQEDFYTAYYLAEFAIRSSPADSDIEEQAQTVKKQAKEIIASGTAGFKREKNRDLFDAKKIAYQALLQKDYKTAYYLFFNLKQELESTDTNWYDPDIADFFLHAKKGFLTKQFFTNEVEYIGFFEIPLNLDFKTKTVNGNKVRIQAEAISHGQGDHANAVYIRNCTVVFWDTLGKLKYHATMPYAKLIPKYENDDSAPLILLTESFHPDTPENPVLPDMKHGRLENFLNEELELAISTDNLFLVIAALDGEQNMTLRQLQRFSPISDDLGFNVKWYTRIITERISDPMLILLAALCALLFARLLCSTRVPKRGTKLSIGLIILPVFAFAVTEMMRYILRVHIAFFTDLFPAFTMPVIFIGLIICSMLIGLMFLRQPAE